MIDRANRTVRCGEHGWTVKVHGAGSGGVVWTSTCVAPCPGHDFPSEAAWEDLRASLNRLLDRLRRPLDLGLDRDKEFPRNDYTLFREEFTEIHDVGCEFYIGKLGGVGPEESA